MSKKTHLTQEGLLELQNELRELKEVKRPEVAEKLKEAISYGDLSENSEYEDARNEQAQIELRIIELEDLLKNYELIDIKRIHKKQGTGVSLGHTVKLRNVEGEIETYKIVGSTEADIFEGKISNESPIGSALIGRNIGEKVTGRSGAGDFEFEILETK